MRTRRIIAIFGILVVAVFSFWLKREMRGKIAQGARIPVVNVQGLDSDRVFLVSPTSPDFDARVQKAAPEWSKVASKAKPFITLVSNQSRRRIVGLTVSFILSRRNGDVDRESVQLKDPDAVLGSGLGSDRSERGEKEIVAGEERLVALFGGIPKFAAESEQILLGWADVFHQPQGQYSDVSSVLIVLDAVVFENGLLLGNDVTNLAGHFDAFLRAKQNVYRSVVRQVEDKVPLEQAFRAEDEKMADPSSFRGQFDIYSNLAIQEAEDLRKQYADQIIIEVFRRLILKEPFVIQKKPN